MNELINNKKKVELLVDAITAKNYGDVILHKDIEDIIQEDRCSTKYSTIISKAKKILLKDHKMYIENIRGDGYRVVFPDNFAIHAIKHYDKGFKELDRGKRVLDNAPIGEMSQEGSITYRRVYDRSVILMASMNGAIVELKKLSREKSPFSPDLINKR